MSKRKMENKSSTANSYFLLQCMMGLTAAAVVTAGTLALLAAKTSTTAGSAGLMAGALVTGAAGALSTIIGIAAMIAAVFLVVCLVAALANNPVVINPHPPRYWGMGGYGLNGLFSPIFPGSYYSAIPVYSHSGSIFSSRNNHGHGDSIFNSRNNHGHGDSTFSSNNNHGHGGASTTHLHR
jgi:hypothetical protein